MRIIRNTRLFAFLQGFIEQLRGEGGRAHESNCDWNIAYDHGMNWADWINARPSKRKGG